MKKTSRSSGLSPTPSSRSAWEGRKSPSPRDNTRDRDRKRGGSESKASEDTRPRGESKFKGAFGKKRFGEKPSDFGRKSFRTEDRDRRHAEGRGGRRSEGRDGRRSEVDGVKREGLGKKPFVQTRDYNQERPKHYARTRTPAERSDSDKYGVTETRRDIRPYVRTRSRITPRAEERAIPVQAPSRTTERLTGGDTHLIWGLHAVRAAWLNEKRRVMRLWLTEAGEALFGVTLNDAKENLLKRPDPKKMERHDLDRLTPPGSVHQGIVCELMPLTEPQLSDLIAGDNAPDTLIMLDQVTDPHNVGAILRSAAALGAAAVIMTERNAPGATGVLAKSASGALEHVPQIHVVNLARALDELQEAGYWRVGLAEEGEKDLAQLDLSGRTVLVLGAEGEGLRQLTRKKCDELARLPTAGPIGSLNVSNAAAVALYEVRRQKKPFG